MGSQPILLERAIPFIFFQHSNILSTKIWILSCSNCFFKQQWSHNTFSRHCTPNTNLWQIQTSFIHSMWVFSTPYSAVLTINVCTQVKQCFIFEKLAVQHINSLWKNCLVSYKLSCEWQPMKLKQCSELMLNASANVGSFHCSGVEVGVGTASYMLVSVSAQVWSLGCVLYSHRVFSVALLMAEYIQIS